MLGVVFFLVMAVRRGWIDEPTRVVLAFLASTALLGVGLWLHERAGRTEAALAAVASAIAGLYASLTAATQLYHLVAPVPGLGVAALVGAVATAIAVRWSSVVVAAIGIVGALVAPVLVDAPTSSVTLAFVGLALAAAVAVLLWQRWNWLALAAFVVSLPQLLAWVADTYERALLTTLAVVVLFWLLYVVAAIGYELRVRTEGLRASSALLLFANAVALVSTGYFVLEDRGYTNGATAWVIAMAGAHVLLGGGVLFAPISREVGALLVAIGIALSGLGFALALDGPALVVGWAVHAFVLAWVARRTGDERASVASAVFLALAFAHILAFEAPLESLRLGVDDLGDAVVALAVSAAAALLSSRLVRAERVQWRPVLEAVGAGALVYLVSVVIVDTWGVTAEGAPRQGGQVALTAFWSIAGLGAVVYGLFGDDRRSRLGGLALLGLAILKVFFYDLAELEELYRVLSFVALGLLLLAGAFAYQRIRLTVARDGESGEAA